MKNRLVVAALTAFSFWGCSASQGTVVPSSTDPSPAFAYPAAGAISTGTVAFKIRIPASNASRRPSYTSPATRSMRISVARTPNGTPVLSRLVRLAPKSPACKESDSSRTCSWIAALEAGRYFASIRTYNGRGVEIGVRQSVPVRVRAATTTLVQLVPSGIPHAISVSGGSYAISRAANGGLTLYGNAAQPVIVTALDANGYAIVGPGAPHYSISVASGSGWSVRSVAAAPNAFDIIPPGASGANATMDVAATSTNEACSQAGAVCGTSFSIADDIQTLFVANSGSGNVTTFKAGAPSTQLSGVTNPTALAMDQDQNLFVANGSANTVLVYAPPYSGAPVAISNQISNPGMLAFGNGNLVVGNENGNVTIYAAPYTGVPIATYNVGAHNLYGIAIDATGDLYVATETTVYKYASPLDGSAPIASIVINPVPYGGGLGAGGIAIDRGGDLVVSTPSGADGSALLIYAQPVTSASQPYARLNDPNEANAGPTIAFAFDEAGDMFISGALQPHGCDIAEFSPPFSSELGPVAQLQTPGSLAAPYSFYPGPIAVDGAGNVFSANTYASNEAALIRYGAPFGSPGYGSTNIRVTTGLDGPSALLMTP